MNYFASYIFRTINTFTGIWLHGMYFWIKTKWSKSATLVCHETSTKTIFIKNWLVENCPSNGWQLNLSRTEFLQPIAMFGLLAFCFGKLSQWVCRFFFHFFWTAFWKIQHSSSIYFFIFYFWKHWYFIAFLEKNKTFLWFSDYHFSLFEFN